MICVDNDAMVDQHLDEREDVLAFAHRPDDRGQFVHAVEEWEQCGEGCIGSLNLDFSAWPQKDPRVTGWKASADKIRLGDTIDMRHSNVRSQETG